MATRFNKIQWRSDADIEVTYVLQLVVSIDGLSFHYCTGVNGNGHTIFGSVLELNCRLKCCQVEVCYFLHA